MTDSPAAIARRPRTSTASASAHRSPGTAGTTATGSAACCCSRRSPPPPSPTSSCRRASWRSAAGCGAPLLLLLSAPPVLPPSAPRRPSARPRLYGGPLRARRGRSRTRQPKHMDIFPQKRFFKWVLFCVFAAVVQRGIPVLHTTRLEISGPFLESLAGNCESFERERAAPNDSNRTVRCVLFLC